MESYFDPGNNASGVLFKYLKALKAKVSFTTCEDCINKHPDYPSLLALSDCLEAWHIPNEAFKIQEGDVKIDTLTFPFIAYVTISGGKFLLIKKFTDGKILFNDERPGLRSISEKEFLAVWDGVILKANTTEKSGEESYQSNQVRSYLLSCRTPLTVLVCLALLFLLLESRIFDSSFMILILIKILGVSVSIMLLLSSLNINNPFIQSLCNINENNCDAILKSKAANVTDWLSWSEIGFFYFSGSLIALVLFQHSGLVLSLSNLCCIPYVAYSLAYQYKAKNWCVLCCVVQALLVSEFLVFAYNYGYHPSELNYSNIIPVVISFSIPISLWSFVKPLLKDAGEAKPIKHQLNRFKYNTELFNRILSNQHKYILNDDLLPIVLGNPQARTIITIVSNPFCGPCAAVHNDLEELLSFKPDIQVKIIFVSKRSWLSTDKYFVVRHLVALAQSDSNTARTALKDWYKSSEKEYQMLVKKYPTFDLERANTAIDKQHQWCEEANIEFTPTIMLNGYKVPDPYKLDDLKYLLT